MGISAHLEMGRRPMHVYTLTLKCTPRGHPKLSLGYFVTVCNRHSTLVHQGCFTFSDNDSGATGNAAVKEAGAAGGGGASGVVEGEE